MNYQVHFIKGQKKGSQLMMKYCTLKKALCLGVAKVKLDGGIEVGNGLPPFDDLGKVTLTIKDYKKKVTEEIQ